MAKQPHYFVAGSALVDVIATIEAPNPPINHLGRTTIAFGGCAYNMAINLATLKVPTCFVTALNDGTFSQMIKQKLGKAGVRQHILTVPELGDAIYTGIFQDGEMVNAVSSTFTHTADFTDEFILAGLKGAKAAIATCCLSAQTLSQIVQLANRNNIPVYLAAISTYEAPRLLEVKGHITACFMNENEMRALSQAAGTKDSSTLAQKLGTTCIVTKGASGVEVFTSQDQQTLRGAIMAVEGNTLGAGDLFMTSTIYALHQLDKPLPEAIQHAFAEVGKILNRDDANIGHDNLLKGDISAIISSAERDKLTQVLNRHGLERKLADLPQNGSVYLAIVDVDHFKKINDTQGHTVGDQVLQAVARKLVDSCRDDDIIGRWGGEEFVCIFHAQNPTQATQIAERIREAMNSISLKPLSTAPTVSIGLCQINRKNLFAKALGQADEALYTAKQTGRNKVVYAGEPNA